MGACTNTTATLTSTVMTCSTVGGPVQSAYRGEPPPPGPMSIHPAHPFSMPHFVGQPERFPGALAGPRGILRPQAGNVQDIWGEASTRSMLRPGFDTSYSVSRSTDRAVDPGASGACYLDHGLVSDSVLVNLSGVHSPRSHGAGLNGTLEARQVDAAGAGTISTGMRLVARAYMQGPDPLGCQEAFRYPVRPLPHRLSSRLEEMCSHPFALRCRALKCKEKGSTLHGCTILVMLLTCPRFHLLLMGGNPASSLKPGERAMPQLMPHWPLV